MFENLVFFTKKLASQCVLTLRTATNFSPEQAPQEVNTYFSLRFDGDNPIQIKGIKEGTKFVGFEIGLIGPDECAQLIKALELGAAELRWQAKLPLEVVPYTPTQEEAEAEAQGRWLAAEVDILALLLFHGQEAVLGGPTVWRYLRSQLDQLPPVMSGPVWNLLLEAYQKEEEPTLSWLDGHIGGEGRVIPLLAAYNPDEAPAAAVEEDGNALRRRIDTAISRYFIVALRGHQLTLLASLATEANEQERQTMLDQLRTLESRQAYLVNQVVG